MLTHQKDQVQVLTISEPNAEEKRFQEERMRDVLVLLQNLTVQEEATIKLIIDCLYDVGSINIINKKISPNSANKLVKWIALRSKPMVRIIAWHWVKKKLPLKVTNWLSGKISFK